MHLDYRSVIFSVCLIELLVACLAGIYALSARPRRRGLLLWALSYVMLLLGTLFVSLRGLVPDIVGVVLANLLLIGFLLFILADLLASGSWDAVMLALNGGVAATLSIALILLHLSVLNEGLAAAARDRELLVREMAHRTKNDLSLVDSLVSIEQQSRAAADPAGSARLEALRDRIRCLSQAHDRLSHSEEPGMVMLEEYLEVIAEGLPRRDGVSVVIRFARVAAPFSYAAPLGLAMNELATNALKYAFPEGRGGTISLSLRAADPADGRTLAELEVRDDGVGTRWPPEKPGLGTMIVQSFASKVDASIGYSFEGGSVFRLGFSLPNRSDRGRPPAPPAR